MSRFNKLMNFFVNHFRSLIRELTRLQRIQRTRRILICIHPLYSAKLRREAIFNNHLASDCCGLFNVVRSASSWIVEHNLFRSTAAHSIRHLIEQLVSRLRIAVASWHNSRVSKSAAARQNRNLSNRIRVMQSSSNKRVSTFVISRVTQLIQSHALRLLSRTSLNAVNRLVNSAIVNKLSARASAKQSRLVKHISQIRARKSRSSNSNHMKIHVWHKRLAFSVNLKNCLTAFQIWGFYSHLAIKSTWAQKRRIKHIWSVCSGNNNQISVVIEAIHLYKQLIKSLLALIVTACHTTSAAASNSVNLVNKDDCWSVLFSLVKQLAHARRAKANKHLNKVRSSHGVERNASFACNCTRKKGFTSSWRAVKQHATRNARAQSLVARRILKEFLNLLNFFYSRLLACNIGELSLRRLAFQKLSTAAAATHAKHSAACACHSAKHKPNKSKQNQNRQHRRNQVREKARSLYANSPTVCWLSLLNLLHNCLALSNRVVELNVFSVIVLLLIALI